MSSQSSLKATYNTTYQGSEDCICSEGLKALVLYFTEAKCKFSAQFTFFRVLFFRVVVTGIGALQSKKVTHFILRAPYNKYDILKNSFI